MGMSIGSASRAIASLAPAGLTRSGRAVASNPDAEKPGQLVRAEEVPEIRAGFGENTLSPSGAALKTIEANLKAARQLVPTAEELRERARAAQARREEAAAATETPPVEFRQRELVRPEPNPAARNFLQEEDRPAGAPEVQNRAPENPEVVGLGPAPPQPAPPGSRLDLQA